MLTKVTKTRITRSHILISSVSLHRQFWESCKWVTLTGKFWSNGQVESILSNTDGHVLAGSEVSTIPPMSVYEFALLMTNRQPVRSLNVSTLSGWSYIYLESGGGRCGAWVARSHQNSLQVWTPDLAELCCFFTVHMSFHAYAWHWTNTHTTTCILACRTTPKKVCLCPLRTMAQYVVGNDPGKKVFRRTFRSSKIPILTFWLLTLPPITSTVLVSKKKRANISCQHATTQTETPTVTPRVAGAAIICKLIR